MRRHIPYRLYMILMCGIYMLMVFVFHGRLQVEISHVMTHTSVLFNNYLPEEMKLREIQHYNESQEFEYADNSLPQKSCFLSSDSVSKQEFHILEPDKAFVYSAYLDKRYRGFRIIRFMAVLYRRDKRWNYSVNCHFKLNNSSVSLTGHVYEMCENHNQLYGGYILSCEVPSNVSNVCQATVSVTLPSEILAGSLSSRNVSRKVTLDVIRISPNTALLKYGVCIPPLFGDIPVRMLVEFIELIRLLGAEHFIFYDHNLTKTVRSVLNFYIKRNILTLVPWKLPSVIDKNSVWYHGQLIAHNDCLYRAMSKIKMLAINDIDEFIIPHNKKRTWDEILERLDNNITAGFTFWSAFYHPSASHEHPSGLLTMRHTGRTKLFSKVRTKVMVHPSRVFEVGIHHVSKPAEEGFKVHQMDTNTAYLHHYRKCVGDFGMKCTEYETDTVMFQYYDDLKRNYDEVLKELRI